MQHNLLLGCKHALLTNRGCPLALGSVVLYATGTPAALKVKAAQLVQSKSCPLTARSALWPQAYQQQAPERGHMRGLSDSAAGVDQGKEISAQVGGVYCVAGSLGTAAWLGA